MSPQPVALGSWDQGGKDNAACPIRAFCLPLVLWVVGTGHLSVPGCWIGVFPAFRGVLRAV